MHELVDKRNERSVGFEPTPPKRLLPEWSALTTRPRALPVDEEHGLAIQISKQQL